MANKSFLEEYPLYKKYRTIWSGDSRFPHSQLKLGSLPKPAVHMFCYVCNSDQTFNMSNEYFQGSTEESSVVNAQVKDLRYTCSACSKGTIVFLVHFLQEKIDDHKYSIFMEKVGQVPAWSIEIEKNLGVILGERTQYYKKGLICESQGYGIGAHAYYRRIVEDIIDELLEAIADHISSKEELAHYEETLLLVKTARIAQEKIQLIKELLPVSLQPNNVNPLQIIYDELSEGIHNNSDEECLESADAIRKALVYLAKQVIGKKTDHENFTDGIQKLLDKKAKKSSIAPKS